MPALRSIADSGGQMFEENVGLMATAEALVGT
jgi:hypothetical protein